MNKAWLYKGKESKLFNEDELQKAMDDGWVDNPTDAKKVQGGPKKTDTPKPSASGATTFKPSASGATTLTSASGATTFQGKE